MTKKKKRLSLAEKSEILSEERTLLSMIRTGLAVLGVGLVVLKLFYNLGWLSYLVAGVLVILGLTIIFEDFIRLQKKRLQLRELEKE